MVRRRRRRRERGKKRGGVGEQDGKEEKSKEGREEW